MEQSVTWQRLLDFAKQVNCEMGFLKNEKNFYPEKSFSLAPMPESSSEDKARMGKLRPSLLLEEPYALSKGELKELKKLKRFPVERVESSWWSFSKEILKKREYYSALTVEGQMVWIFEDTESGIHFLHGFFD